MYFDSAESVRKYRTPKLYQKEAQVEVVQLDVPFEIVTWVNGELERTMFGAAGDYVCIGVTGEVWRVEKNIFEQTYVPVEKVEYPLRVNVVIQDARYVFNKFFKIIAATFKYRLRSGAWSENQTRLVFERGASVAVIVHNVDNNTIELVRQFRFPTYVKLGGWIDELPAGQVNEGESPYECALREVEEEIGYKVSGLTHVNTFYVSPGGTSECVVLYYAEVHNDDRVSEGGGLWHEGEHIELKPLPVQDIPHYLNSVYGDAKTIIGLQWFMAERSV